MGSSISEYLLVKVALPAAAVNVALAALAGVIVFPTSRAVPLAGLVSASTDTLVASFLIGLTTMILVAFGTSIEARGGRVRGFGWKDQGATWARDHRFLSGLVLGAFWLLLLGLPATQWLRGRAHHLDAESGAVLSRAFFLAFKATFSGLCGVLAAVVAAIVALAPEVDVTKDPRWCRRPNDPTVGATYPLEYADKGSLAATSRQAGVSTTPTWELRVRGNIHPDDVKTALADLVTRYPSLATKVQSLDGVPPIAAKYRYAHDPSFSVDAIFDAVDVRNPTALSVLLGERRSRFLDLFTQFPMALTLVNTGDDNCRLVFRQHHAIADGRAFIALLTDFVAFLNDARARWRPPEKALAPVHRLSDVDAFGLSSGKRRAYALAGFGLLVRSTLRTIITPLTPLAQNRSNDYSGENATLHWCVRDDVLTAWNAARKRFEVSLNTLLTGALFLANQRVHRARGLPLGRTNAQLLMETRPRDRPFVSFANHLAFLEAEADLAKVSDPAELLRSIQAQVARQRDHDIPAKRLLCERVFLLALPLEQIQKIIFESKRPAYNLNFSNLIALDFPPLEGEGWSVEDVMITTPVAPRHGIVLTVIHYRGKLVFNFNYKTTAAPRDLVEAIIAAFRAVLKEMTGEEGEALDV